MERGRKKSYFTFLDWSPINPFFPGEFLEPESIEGIVIQGRLLKRDKEAAQILSALMPERTYVEAASTNEPGIIYLTVRYRTWSQVEWREDGFIYTKSLTPQNLLLTAAKMCQAFLHKRIQRPTVRQCRKVLDAALTVL